MQEMSTNSSTNAVPIRLTITKLMSAAKQNDIEAIRGSLENYGLPTNGSKTTDYTVLQLALQRKHKEIAKLLIQHGCNVNNPTNNEDYQPTPLYTAVNLKDDEIVFMLLQKGAIIDIKDHRSGQSPAHLAVVNRSVNILWKLLHFKMNINFPDSNGKSILQLLLEQAVHFRRTPTETVNLQVVRKIMECKASLNFRSTPGNHTPLHLAALLPQRDVLKILLPHVADLNHVDSELNSVLHSLLSTKFACSGTAQEQENLEIIEAMLTRGARPDAMNKFIQVPAHLAAKNRHLNALLVLLKSEKYINRLDHEGKTILHRLLEDFKSLDTALIELYRVVVKVIVEKGGKGDLPSTLGITALHLAAQQNAKDPNILWIMVQGNSIDVNVRDKSGNTVLHIIAQQLDPNLELVKLLVAKGVKVDIKNKVSNMSPLQIAAKNNNAALLSEFLPYITDVNEVDSPDGNTMLHHLLRNSSNQKLIEILLQKGASVDKRNKRGLAPTFYAAETKQISLLLTLLRLSQDLAGQALMRDSQTNRTLLHLVLNAISPESCEVLRILLLGGALIDQLDSEKNMPLHQEVLYNHPDLLDLLIANVSNMNLCGNEGRTLVLFLDRLPLEQIRNNEAEIVKLIKMLLNCGASLEGTNDQGETVVDLACRSKELIRVVLEHGQGIATFIDAKGNTILHSHLMDKMENRSIQTVSVLLEKGIPVEAQNKDGETPMHLAAKHGELDILQLILEKIEDVNIKDQRGNDVLHVLLSTKIALPPSKTTDEEEAVAVEENVFNPITSEKEKKILAIIEKLLQKGLEMNAVNNAGETHFHLACRSFRIEACKYLLQCGAEPQICDKLGNGSLHFMAQAETENLGDTSTVTLEQEMVWNLMSRGCNADGKNYLGRTALHIAAKHGRTHVLEALVSSGTDINCMDSVSGATPLHLAAANRNANVIGILVMCGADINARQTDGSSILQVVLHNPLKEDDIDDGLVCHLLELGADPEQRDNYGKTALHWACWNDDRDGLRALLDHGASLDAEDEGGFPPLHYATGGKTRIEAVLHLTKLQTAGITINEKNENYLVELVETFDLKETIKSMHYEAEVHLLDQILIDRNTTLYDFLHMDVNSLSVYANNLMIQNILNDGNFDTNFAHYGRLLKSCVHIGKIRSELLTAATESLSRLAEKSVPIECSIKIFNPSFSDENLRCIIKAGTNPTKSKKRRFSCNEDDEKPKKRARRSSV